MSVTAPDALPVLHVDQYADSFTRLSCPDVTSTPVDVTVALATAAGPGGQLFPDLASIPDGAAVWADFNGQLGKVHRDGTDILGDTLKAWITAGDVLTVHRDDATEPGHPALVVTAVTPVPSPEPPPPSTPPMVTPARARHTLAAHIRDTTAHLTVYPSTVANPVTPSVMIEGAGFNVTTACVVQYAVKVTVLGAAQTIPDDLDDVEMNALVVYAAVAAAGWLVGEASQPAVVTVSGDGFLSVEFTATTRLGG